MTKEDVFKMRDLAEEGKVQFKERINDRYDVGCEVVAMSNTHGGKLVIGIDDKTGKIEIHSPGTLPGGLTVDDILSGTSMPRNTFLFNNAIHLLPYTGAGSGMMRVKEYRERMTFENNERLHEFVVTVHRSAEIVAQNEAESRAIIDQNT